VTNLSNYQTRREREPNLDPQWSLHRVIDGRMACLQHVGFKFADPSFVRDDGATTRDVESSPVGSYFIRDVSWFTTVV